MEFIKKQTSVFYAWLATGMLTLLAFIDVLSAGAGSGFILNTFSLKWMIAIILFAIGAILLLTIGYTFPRLKGSNRGNVAELITTRNRSGALRYLISGALVFLFTWSLLFTNFGVIFDDLFFRLWFAFLTIVVTSFLITAPSQELISWPGFISASLLLGVVFIVGSHAIYVTDYPFKQYWSEGNRFWDYSTFFGDHLYHVLEDQEVISRLDRRRGELWGLPFLFFAQPGIWLVRLWDLGLSTLPYALLGGVVIWRKGISHKEMLAGASWSLLFLNQGPIYAPLVFGSILAFISMKLNWWLRIPLLLYATYYLEIGRSTWVFAPILFAILFFLLEAAPEKRMPTYKQVAKLLAIALVCALAAIIALDRFAAFGSSQALPQSPQNFLLIIFVNPIVEFTQSIVRLLTRQPLDWLRLLPNSAYKPGILIGLCLATLPMIGVAIIAIRQKNWSISRFQVVAASVILFSFLLVGLTVSVKVGGGLDLHNLDMFLIALLIAFGIGWKNGIRIMLNSISQQPKLFQGLAVLMIIMPVLPTLNSARPLSLPDPLDTQQALQEVQAYVQCAKQYGEVLFIDERQLLTFGYVEAPLISSYEKKFMMDEAMEGDVEYFQEFYADINMRRFSLIISEAQTENIKDAKEGLSFENNAWVKWVSIPLLEQYEQVSDNKKIPIELYLPIDRDFQCP